MQNLPPYTENSVEYLVHENGGIQATLYVGYKIKNADIYTYKKHKIGCLEAGQHTKGTILEFKNKMTDTARELYLRIPRQASLQYNLYAYHLGADYQIDASGQITGEWPLITTIKLPYEAKFAVTKNQIPEGLEALKLLWP